MNKNINFDSYPTLFHKYSSNLSSLSDEIFIYKQNDINFTVNQRILVHIHCSHLALLLKYFKNHLLHFGEKRIICTFSIGDPKILNAYKDTILFLQVKNKGFDIGGKICCLHYLHSINYDYDAIIFLHSKSNDSLRKLYCDSFKNIPLIENLIYNQGYIGIFPNLIHSGNGNDNFIGTEKYREEILNLLECKNKSNIFAEGNCMALHRSVIDFVFKDRCELFYNILNNEDTFDVNWYKFYYSLENKTNEEAYEIYKSSKKKQYGNNFEAALKNDRQIRDCMVEHVFERIWLNVINHLGGSFFCL